MINQGVSWYGGNNPPSDAISAAEYRTTVIEKLLKKTDGGKSAIKT